MITVEQSNKQFVCFSIAHEAPPETIISNIIAGECLNLTFDKDH